MKQSHIFPLFCMTTFVAALFLSTHAFADVCNYEETPISITAIDKPMPDILQEIAEQTQLTIDVENIEALTVNRSIMLEETPLDQSLKRLLKDVNYSVICDDKKKSLTLVLFDKSYVASSRPSGNNSANTAAQTSSQEQGLSSHESEEELDAISAALNAYNNGEVAATSGEDPEEMRGITEALQEYHDNQANGNLPVETVVKKTTMDKMNEALEHYSSKNETTPAPDLSTSSSPGEMGAVDDAFREHQALNTSNQGTEQSTLQSAQSEIDKAFNEYNSRAQK